MHDNDVLTLAYSPCPNDTYIFAALTNGWIEGAPQIRVRLEDIENLNSAALKHDFDLIKVSYAIVPELLKNYTLLRAGGALGHGCGPLVVAKPGAGKSLEDLENKIVAIPGERTTAFMLLTLAMRKRPQTIAMRFDSIVDAVASGTVDAGLIIHESRFTYQESDLVSVADLGEWWEAQTNLPVPLGAIMLRNDHAERADEINEAIRKSLRYARTHEKEVMKYVREHASEMEDSVIRKHIETYVNNFSDDAGEEGIAAANELFRRASEQRVIPQAAQVEFV